MEHTLSEKEVNERVAVLKRFKTLLQQQKHKFNEYLVVLETQEKSIKNDNDEAVAYHAELEESIIGDIFNIQKVIDPIEKMYSLNGNDKDDELFKLKDDLNSIKNRVMNQNKKNRELLQIQMDKIQMDLSLIQKTKSNIYTMLPSSNNFNSASGNVIDFSI